MRRSPTHASRGCPRAAGGREGRGHVGEVEVEVEEDGGDDGRIGEEREDSHLATAGGTEQRQHVVDPREQDGPADSRGRGWSGGGFGRGDIAFGCWCLRYELGPAECHRGGLSLAFGASTPW